MARHSAKVTDWTNKAPPKVARIVAPLLLGGLLGLGHDLHALGPVYPVFVLVIIYLATPLDGPKMAARFGWLLGLGYFGWTLRWLIEPFLVDIARHGWMAPFAIALMAGGLALFWALAFWLARWVVAGRAMLLLSLPFTWAAAEMLRGHVFTGFPWGLVSYTLVGSPADVWLAWVGPYGTTVVMFCVAGASAYVLARKPIWSAGVVIVMVSMTWGLFSVTPAAPEPTGKTVRVVQPNAPQHQKWDRAWMPVFFDRAIALTMADAPVDVVVWPETSVPAVLDYAGPWLDQMALAARGAPVVAGIQRREAGAYYNSLVVVDKPEEIAGLYDKSHLVPFGEYIPFAWLLEPLGLGVMVEQVAGFAPGDGPDLVEIDGLGWARVLICYEGIFPEDMQRGEARADVLLIVTNDAWFGNGPGPRQHLAQAQARAIEQGLPVVRSANTGISAVIDARGHIVAQLPLGEAGFVDAAVPQALPPTLYARMGDWPLVVLLVLVMGSAAVARKRFSVDHGGAGG